MCQLGIELMTSVRRARSQPSEAHLGQCEATGRRAGAPHHKTTAPILQPSVHLPVAGQGPDMPRPPPHSHRGHSQHTHLQSEQQADCNLKQKAGALSLASNIFENYLGQLTGSTDNSFEFFDKSFCASSIIKFHFCFCKPDVS